MIDLEKLVSNNTNYSRKEVKKLISQGLVSINNQSILENLKINTGQDLIFINNQEVYNDQFVYLVINKPKNYICANQDSWNNVIFELLDPKYRYIKGLHTVGRLDKDTTGLLLLTNDGAFSHNLLSPNKHISKKYLVDTKNPLKIDLVTQFEQGIDIGEKKLTKPAKLEIIDQYRAFLTINEGKFHQVKRMFQKVDNEVIELQRVSFGKLELDQLNLQVGEYRELTKQEIEILKNAKV
ncbi:16S rRNA pseudouridine(516) synthase [Mycoplasmopsis glycophila]|uniref:Pseudouridine synthase n=1 Tax=Mycoplasmopsis glycophila TaxID=171285 RepID=A0A449AWD9_9BACT|nr:16S rRNA pseudouridine(516) synthase [Mycoplasmopsis glycophila]VEU70999.1 Pseudouridine synthase [Mycoplasmopsis glycophila]